MTPRERKIIQNKTCVQNQRNHNEREREREKTILDFLALFRLKKRLHEKTKERTNHRDTCVEHVFLSGDVLQEELSEKREREKNKNKRRDHRTTYPPLTTFIKSKCARCSQRTNIHDRKTRRRIERECSLPTKWQRTGPISALLDQRFVIFSSGTRMNRCPTSFTIVLETGDIGTEERGKLAAAPRPGTLVAQLIVQHVRFHFHLESNVGTNLSLSVRETHLRVCRSLRAAIGRNEQRWPRCNFVGWRKPLGQLPWGTSVPGPCRCQHSTRPRTVDP